jgi:3-oxoacyl-[acyl-carrier protein] reductase
MELEQRTAVVTGSSSGIGCAIALELARRGANVLIHARRSREAAEDAARTVRELGRETTIVLCDLADPTQFERFVQQAWDWRGGIDIWVNNAGVDVLTGEAASWPFHRKLEALWALDVRATIALGRLIGARMQAAGSGAILNIGWDQAQSGMEGDSGQLFAATKGAVMAFTKSLAATLAPQVRVNCLAPGWIKTAWGDHASELWQRRAVRESQLGRWGIPQDVARVAAYLASDDAAYVTGQILEVNGGFQRR